MSKRIITEEPRQRLYHWGRGISYADLPAAARDRLTGWIEMPDYDRNAPLTGDEIRAMRAYLDAYPVEHWPPEGMEFFDILRIAATLEQLTAERDLVQGELDKYLDDYGAPLR